ncbi:cytochrome c [Roseimicrobium gellanilyticum]|uniref:Cytochrome c n=1 Tax=Roseimicrobium gellanilyticum TaxID=748857 RepID=A0A366HGR3_9BACT|nr:c-type cytochrome domain-containing protein [Roseimicrobium gellanilyticum]RBP41260.1 cytochrome c [Roseimicrobium gellanilyticum]
MTAHPNFFKVPAIAALLMGVSAQGAVNFKTEILPVLEAKCVKCHKAEHEEGGKIVKPKAELRLDAAWAMLKGGESKRPALVAKDTAKSYMFEVVNLPKDDDMFMPPKGDPLTAEEIAKLKTWIEEGADFGDWEGNLAGKPADAPSTAKAAPKEREHDILYKKLSEGLQPPSKEALKKVQEAGAQVTILQVGGPLVRVDFLTGVSKTDDAKIAAILPIKDNIAHLDLARTVITDASLKTVASFPRLVRLDLRKTKVTDKGVQQLAECKNLAYLNLYGTEVTDAVIPALSSLKTLRDVFIWETKVTEAGAAKLKAALPEAEVVASAVMPAPQQAPAGGNRRRDK